jgi:hypothetical protein
MQPLGNAPTVHADRSVAVVLETLRSKLGHFAILYVQLLSTMKTYSA